VAGGDKPEGQADVASCTAPCNNRMGLIVPFASTIVSWPREDSLLERLEARKHDTVAASGLSHQRAKNIFVDMNHGLGGKPIARQQDAQSHTA
jgi:hypothetical protein